MEVRTPEAWWRTNKTLFSALEGNVGAVNTTVERHCFLCGNGGMAVVREAGDKQRRKKDQRMQS